MTRIARARDRAWYAAKTVLASSPSLAVRASRARGRGILVTPDTDVVIEGFPRSANSFSVAAFGMAQPHPIRVAHHTHAPGHVIRAIQLGVPRIVLIREPPDPILEYLLLRPSLELTDVLHGYVRFYRCLLPYRDRVVVAPFQEVTTDFGNVIRRVNDRFGTSFVPFDHTTENERAVFDAMDSYWRGQVGPGERLELVVGRPSTLREERKARLREEFDRRSGSTLVQQVRAIHAAMLEPIAGKDAS